MRPCSRNSAGNHPGTSVPATLYRYAAATPMPISVHMFGLRLRIDWAQRTKNGHAAHSTTGVANANSAQVRAWGDSTVTRWPSIARPSATSVSGRVRQNRRRKSTSSWLSSSSAVGIIGSSAMPQIGQLPGALRTISGCIGQV